MKETYKVVSLFYRYWKTYFLWIMKNRLNVNLKYNMSGHVSNRSSRQLDMFLLLHDLSVLIWSNCKVKNMEAVMILIRRIFNYHDKYPSCLSNTAEYFDPKIPSENSERCILHCNISKTSQTSSSSSLVQWANQNKQPARSFSTKPSQSFYLMHRQKALTCTLNCDNHAFLLILHW